MRCRTVRVTPYRSRAKAPVLKQHCWLVLSSVRHAAGYISSGCAGPAIRSGPLLEAAHACVAQHVVPRGGEQLCLHCAAGCPAHVSGSAATALMACTCFGIDDTCMQAPNSTVDSAQPNVPATVEPDQKPVRDPWYPHKAIFTMCLCQTNAGVSSLMSCGQLQAQSMPLHAS